MEHKKYKVEVGGKIKTFKNNFWQPLFIGIIRLLNVNEIIIIASNVETICYIFI